MSLTHNQTVRLLAYLAAHDQRTVGEEDILVWREASELGRWTMEEAQLAVRRLANEQRSYRVQPADVTATIRTGRQEASMRETLEERKKAKAEIAGPVKAALERGIGDRSGRVDHLGTSHVDAIYEQQGWSRLTRAAVRFACPWCREPSGRRCTKQTPHGVAECENPHPSRSSLAVACVRCGAEEGDTCDPAGAHPHHARTEDALGAQGKAKRSELVKAKRDASTNPDWHREADFTAPGPDDEPPPDPADAESWLPQTDSHPFDLPVGDQR